MRSAYMVVVLTVALALPCAASSAGRTLHVQVRTTPVRPSPSFLGVPRAELAYGDTVQVIREQGPWQEVRVSDSLSGWVHGSALTRQRVRLSGSGGGDAEVTATGDEIAIAGKGFNEQVEQEFKDGEAQADFTWVDRAEAVRISTDEISRFLHAGGLRDPAEGGTP